jgi:hypothetical protein
MDVQIVRDEEVCLEPYLAVRFCWTLVWDGITRIQWQVMINDGHLPPHEVNEQIKTWLAQADEERDLSQELLLEAREAIELNAADEKLHQRREEG